MAVTVPALAQNLGIESRDANQTAELQDILDAAIATVEEEAPSAPEAVNPLGAPPQTWRSNALRPISSTSPLQLVGNHSLTPSSIPARALSCLDG